MEDMAYFFGCFGGYDRWTNNPDPFGRRVLVAKMIEPGLKLKPNKQNF